MLKNLHIVLVETRFPENIGAVARASANFGQCPIHLVQPERWDKEKAIPLATKQGALLLETISIHENLANAVKNSIFCVGTTARIGGRRRDLLSPKDAAKEIIQHLMDDDHVSLILGPEDRGLENHHLDLCQRTVCIPTVPGCSSLNLGQAALIILYECFLALPKIPKPQKKDKKGLSRRINSAERQLLHIHLKTALMHLDVLQKDNPDFFFLPLAHILDKVNLRRHEMDLIMGICRQINTFSKK